MEFSNVICLFRNGEFEYKGVFGKIECSKTVFIYPSKPPYDPILHIHIYMCIYINIYIYVYVCVYVCTYIYIIM